MARPGLPNAEEIVLRLLEEAAEGGQPCPSNDTLCAAIGAKSIASAARVVAALEARGLIEVERGPKSRVVTVVATGASTALPAPPGGPRRADELAELMAEGWNLSAAAVTMDLSRQRVDQIWRWICSQLGPQGS